MAKFKWIVIALIATVGAAGPVIFSLRAQEALGELPAGQVARQSVAQPDNDNGENQPTQDGWPSGEAQEVSLLFAEEQFLEISKPDKVELDPALPRAYAAAAWFPHPRRGLWR